MSLDFINELSVLQFFALCLFIFSSGYFLSYYMGLRLKDTHSNQQHNLITTHVLALLIFILGFSFNLSLTRFEYRRELAIQESNAIGTAYLRSQLIDSGDQEIRKKLFGEYIDLRIKIFEEKKPTLELNDIRKAQSILWQDMKAFVQDRRDSVAVAYLNSLNVMLETASERNFALEKMLPISFYLFIFIVTISGVGLMTYDSALQGKKTHLRSLIFIFILALLISFIFDMDHYRTGMIQITQDSLRRIKSIL